MSPATFNFPFQFGSIQIGPDIFATLIVMEDDSDERNNTSSLRFDPITPEDLRQLRSFYYQNQNFVGRDKLWYAYRKAYPQSKISQRTLLNDFLKKQELWQRSTKNLGSRGSIKPILSREEGNLQIDCINLTAIAFNGYKYVVNATDILTKKLYSMAMRSQDQQSIVRFLERLQRDGVVMKSFASDVGTEFGGLVQDWCRENNVLWKFGQPGVPMGQGQIESVNKNLKNLIYSSIRFGKKDWPNYLQKLVDNLNNTMTYATGKAANEILQEEHPAVFEKIRNKKLKGVRAQIMNTFEIGDVVRKLIRLQTGIKRRAKVGYFSEETYKVAGTVKSRFAGYVDSYKLTKMDDTPLPGLTPANDLRLVPAGTVDIPAENRPPPDDNNEFEVSSILDRRIVRRGRRRVIQYKVLWRGYDAREATWEDEDALENAREAIAEFEEEH